jgi:8-oxo-dGTP diphosphatase
MILKGYQIDMEEQLKRPKVGVGVVVVKEGKVLLGKRKNAHGDGSWSLPGGHLEYGETIEECALREVDEEVGVKIKNLRLGPYTNDIFPNEQKHYITLYVISDYLSGQVEIKEPDKCERWEWFEWNNLPEPLFIPMQNLIKTGYNPFND